MSAPPRVRVIERRSLDRPASLPRLADFCGWGSLHCPRGCANGGNLHHMRVEIFERKEDALHVGKTTVEGKLTHVEYLLDEISGNPSSRRNGLRIHFYCEDCGDGLIFNIAQHKGSTFLYWTINDPTPEWLERWL